MHGLEHQAPAAPESRIDLTTQLHKPANHSRVTILELGLALDQFDKCRFLSTKGLQDLNSSQTLGDDPVISHPLAAKTFDCLFEFVPKIHDYLLTSIQRGPNASICAPPGARVVTALACQRSIALHSVSLTPGTT